jgi:hypothetical protein
MIRNLWARESVGLSAEYALSKDGAPVDITGWIFAQSLARVHGAVDLTLGMAANAEAQGFFITNGPAGKYQVRITSAALKAIADTTGDYTLLGDIIATQPGGTRVWIEDQALQVTEGTTL